MHIYDVKDDDLNSEKSAYEIGGEDSESGWIQKVFTIAPY